MAKYKLVCFDLDDTLTTEIHSVMYLCILYNKLDELIAVDEAILRGAYDWIEADHILAKEFAGFPVSWVEKELRNTLKPLNGIEETIRALHAENIKCIVITAGPRQVAEAGAKIWGFDAGFGSDYEEKDGLFTGKIPQHLGDTGKIDCLKSYIKKHGIEQSKCVAVGDGITDIPLFGYCGKSVAINYAPEAEGKATHYLRTKDLREILQYII